MVRQNPPRKAKATAILALATKSPSKRKIPQASSAGKSTKGVSKKQTQKTSSASKSSKPSTPPGPETAPKSRSPVRPSPSTFPGFLPWTTPSLVPSSTPRLSTISNLLNHKATSPPTRRRSSVPKTVNTTLESPASPPRSSPRKKPVSSQALAAPSRSPPTPKRTWSPPKYSPHSPRLRRSSRGPRYDPAMLYTGLAMDPFNSPSNPFHITTDPFFITTDSYYSETDSHLDDDSFRMHSEIVLTPTEMNLVDEGYSTWREGLREEWALIRPRTAATSRFWAGPAGSRPLSRELEEGEKGLPGHKLLYGEYEIEEVDEEADVPKETLVERRDATEAEMEAWDEREKRHLTRFEA